MQPLRKIGSVKTNIGHLEAAAGIAGVIKVLMMLKNRKIPPLVGLKSSNPIINFEETPFIIAGELEDWKKSKGTPLRAGVSSFGMGGVNSHAIIEEYPLEKTQAKRKHNSHFFLLSAKSEKSFSGLMDKWNKFVNTQEFRELSLEDICGTSLLGRKHFSFRNGTGVQSKNEIMHFLKQQTAFSPDSGGAQWNLDIGIPNFNGYSEVSSIGEFSIIKDKFDDYQRSYG